MGSIHKSESENEEVLWSVDPMFLHERSPPAGMGSVLRTPR